MKRRTLIAGAISLAGLAATENVLAQPIVASKVKKLKAADVKAPKAGFVQADIEAIYQVPVTETDATSPVVVLKARGQDLYSCIWIGLPESISIAWGLENNEAMRPLSHDLMLALVKALQGRVEAVSLYGPVGETFYANVNVVGQGVETEVDSRPSDALALAVRVGAPILVATQMMRQMTLDEVRKELKQP